MHRKPIMNKPTKTGLNCYHIYICKISYEDEELLIDPVHEI